jgi:hypothetical protein
MWIFISGLSGKISQAAQKIGLGKTPGFGMGQINFFIIISYSSFCVPMV